MSDSKNIEYSGLEIAVIGMAGRFPKANNIFDYWTNLKNGEEAITFFSKEELIEAGISNHLINNPAFVKANSFIEGKDNFDFSFFNYTFEEANVMDPQIRIFHECVWQALEDAGYDSLKYNGIIGLYAGANNSFKWEIFTNLFRTNHLVDDFSLSQLNNKDYLSTRIAYKFNLKGPSIVVNSACSTSLVAIHNACEGLLLGECDLAIAGGISLNYISKTGYLYKEGMILSPDGHCRTFDRDAKGTISGEGVGVVVLKRLKNAISHRDNIWAIIKGSAINNDGNRKIGFTAPSIEGQVDVIKKAQKMAKVAPEDISYIETHGTGTPLGDSLEIEALNIVFGKNFPNKHCGLGSVKTNIGHLDTAAGIAGFIKTVMALKYRKIPASLNYNLPNPKIEAADSPFYVNTKLKDWIRNSKSLKAGVTSLGIGGTNAHIVLEEAPCIETSNDGKKYKLLMFSGKTITALSKNIQNIQNYLSINKNLNLADAAYTLQIGRHAFPYRKVIVCENRKDIISAKLSVENLETFYPAEKNPVVVFMFPGQGSQFINMGKELYDNEPYFKDTLDTCFEIARKISNKNFKENLFWENSYNESKIHNTGYTQPILFLFEYSLAQLLLHWGIKPNIMIGHSIGEYVAACLSNVFSLEEAIKLVIKRGELIEKLECGSMLSISISEKELSPFINEEINLAAVNTANSCVVSGSTRAINLFEKKLDINKIYYKKLNTSHAFHSYMLDPILEEFENTVKTISLQKPQIPYISNLTGKIISEQDILNHAYWSNHLRQTVRFSEGTSDLLKNENSLFIEIGPGNTLSSFIHSHGFNARNIFSLLKSKYNNDSEYYYFLENLGKIWCQGVAIDCDAFYKNQQRQKISLPTYAFDKYQFPTDFDIRKLIAEKMTLPAALIKSEIADWFYIPIWEQSFLSAYNIEINPKEEQLLVFANDKKIELKLINKLFNNYSKIIIATIGEGYSKENENHYLINPSKTEDYSLLFKDLLERTLVPDKIIHFWTIEEDHSEDIFNSNYFEKMQDLGFYSLLNIAKTIGELHITKQIKIDIVTNELHEVHCDEKISIEVSTILGALKIIPLEFLNIKCRNIDIKLTELNNPDKEELILGQLVKEISSDSLDKIVAYRGENRYIQNYSPIHLNKEKEFEKRLKMNGVYLITGGTGGMGLSIAEFLAKEVKAKIILISRSKLPDRKEWQAFLNSENEENETKVIIRKIINMEELGATIIVESTDVSDLSKLKEVINKSQKILGHINGIIHTAGVIDYGGIILNRSKEVTSKYMSPKVEGTIALDKIFRQSKLDFFILFSSIGNVLYINKFGQISYNASNEFLESYATYKKKRDKMHITTINWCDWKEVGMSVKANLKKITETNANVDLEKEFENALSPAEGVEVFKYILGSSLTNVTVTKFDLPSKISQMNKILNEKKESLYLNNASVRYLIDRPVMAITYVPPKNDFEKKIVEFWTDLLGIKTIGTKDNFFELGGDSLKVMTLLSKMMKKFDINIPLKVFVETPTIENISKYIEAANWFANQDVPKKNSSEEIII